MKLTRERKIFGAVLGIAVAALGVNQLIPGAASAGSPEDFAVSPSKAVAAPASPVLGPIATHAGASFTIAEQLAAFEAKHDYSTAKVKDAFAASWRPPKVEAVVQKKPEGPTEAEIINRFQQTHALTAVMTASQGGFAMIKGVPIAVGKTVDGFKLISVTKRTATFQSPEGSPVVLNLTQTAVQSADASR